MAGELGLFEVECIEVARRGVDQGSRQFSRFLLVYHIE